MPDQTRLSPADTTLLRPRPAPVLRTIVGSEDDVYVVTNRPPKPRNPDKVPRLEARAIAAVAAIPDLSGIEDGAVRSFIRAVIDPCAELARLTPTAIRRENVVGGSAVTTYSSLLVHCLTALEQPRNRSKGQQFKVSDPQFGQLVDGTTHIRFQSPRHMRDVQRDVIARSLPGALRRRRHIEILETGVRRNLVIELAYVTFGDQTHPQWILNIRDGISRWATMLAGLTGNIPGNVFSPAPNPERRTRRPPSEAAAPVAKALADIVVPIDGLISATSAKALVELGVRRHKDLVNDYTAHAYPVPRSHPGAQDEQGAAVAGENRCHPGRLRPVGPSSSSVTDGMSENVWGLVLRQFATVPATVVLRATDSTGAMSSVREATESLVADLHTGVDSWDGGDRQLFDSKRALRAMWADGHLPDDEARLWLGLRPVQDVDIVFPSDRGADPTRAGLRFLTYFYSRMLGPDLYETVKTYLRSTLDGKYTFARTVDVLAPLANQHWDSTKPLSRLWSYQGGPLLEDVVRRDGLIVQAPSDYRVLVPQASAGNRQARAELALAGGAALIGDDVVTTTLVGGSGSATHRLPFRGTTREIFDLLSTSPSGLMTLALAANHFDPASPSAEVRHRVADVEADDDIARDVGQTPLRLFERDVATLLAAAKTLREEHSSESPSQSRATGADPCDTRQAHEAHLARQLQALPGLVAGVERAALEALDLRTRSGATDAGFSAGAAEAMAEKLTRTSMSIARLSR